ncbi:MAG: AmmeMemoRadiSam system protein A [Clostridia bacterium]|nr:AmmeMemoRadiSam system protein A [Clostridia bacterium]
MGRIINSYVFPHPPLIVPEVGRGSESGAAETVKAVIKAAEEIGRDKPTTIILTTPHGPVFQDYIYVSASENLTGNLGKFGAKSVSMHFRNNLDMVNLITRYAKMQGIFAGGLEDSIARKYNVSKDLDHGALVPLYFIHRQFSGFKLVHISVAGLPLVELYRFGMCIARAVKDMDEKVVFAASGDLSHRLTSDAPYGFSREGREFDEMFVEAVKSKDPGKLLEMDEDFCERAGECGLRSFIIMFGAMDGYDMESEVYSYEGPFGVGYSVARITPLGENPAKRILEKHEERNNKKMEALRQGEDAYVALARKTLETYVKEGRIINVPQGLPEEMIKEQAGVFVSIKKQGQLRGCIGTISPTKKNIAEEIIQNAISSGTRDPRFDPVEAEELEKLVYSVDVLMEPEPIDSMDQLDVIKYGVIVRAGNRSGLLLPNLEGVNSPEEQVSIALQKAGIRQGEKFEMERFEVIRHR